MNVKIKDNTLIVEIPLLPEPQVSSTGRSLHIANTHGPVPTTLTFQGKPVKVSLFASIKKDN